jgi:chitinase
LPSVDYINVSSCPSTPFIAVKHFRLAQTQVMSYDLMNRRDNVTKHHSSVAGSEAMIKNYLTIGAPRRKSTVCERNEHMYDPHTDRSKVGFAYYAKYFTTQGDCGTSALGCPIMLAEDPIMLAEDPIMGQDLLTSGAWTFEKTHMSPVDSSALTISYDGTCGPEKATKCSLGCGSQYGNCGSGACQHAFGTGCVDPDVAGSWQLAPKNGLTGEQAGGQYYSDAQNRLF